MNYVYTGNVSDRTRQSTYCPGCGEVLVGRDGYRLSVYGLEQDRCRGCGRAIAGRFGDGPGDWGPRRQPVRIANYARPRSLLPTVPQATVEQGNDKAMAQVPLPAADDSHGEFRLAPDQEQLILQAAGRRLIAAVLGQIPTPLESRWPPCAVGGGRSVRNVEASGSAAELLRLAGAGNAAFQGHRAGRRCRGQRGPAFPPISPVELPYLDMDVWLLGKLEPVLVPACERRSAVIIGKHGLRIAKRDRQGLLLPGVAVEHRLDALGFLEQVCHKAGLPADAWQDEDAALMTFQGHAIEGELKSVERGTGSRAAAMSRPGPSRADLGLLADSCRQNFRAVMMGATPMFYVPGAFDGGIQGIVLSLQLPGADRIDSSQVNILRGMPLQSTLFELTKAVAGRLQQGGVHPTALSGAALGITVLWDAAMHGSPQAPQLQGLDPHDRAVFVVQQSRWWSPEPAARPKISCARPSIYCGRQPRPGHRFSAWQPSRPPIGSRSPVCLKPAPAATSACPRPPDFYPRDAGEIGRTLDKWFADKPQPEAWAAVMVPHAGWVYSGQLAADVFSRVKFPKQVIVLAPDIAEGVEWAVAPHHVWQLPGGSIDSDPDLARRLADSIPGLELDAAAHAHEHAIEVQLPLLARLAPRSRVVGITIHAGESDELERFGQQLAGVLPG